ncbi:hypothetical protein LUW75_05845 [Streptomyces sp. MRC013]|uniref:hypothetical protein n=1 Tax=Streptomyces sp. MRC013 TaxID=2898276 RepID=UPI0020260311|nr:hypothetical protein [Streptomyces sp. MRC013]URM89588.1 hypothetical protein LUW75_05845 [Streptomyces sp. MRC013]
MDAFLGLGFVISVGAAGFGYSYMELAQGYKDVGLGARRESGRNVMLGGLAGTTVFGILIALWFGETDGDLSAGAAVLLRAGAGVLACLPPVAAVAYRAKAVRRRRRARTADREHRRVAGEAVRARHDRVRERYGAYLSDVFAVLDHPAMTDVRVPTTESLVRALAAADDAAAAAGTGHAGLSAYREAVAAAEIAFEKAQRYAHEVGTGLLPARERDTVALARKLLTTALDGGGTPEERRSAYRRARSLLDGVVPMPPRTSAALDGRLRRALPPAPCPGERPREQDR